MKTHKVLNVECKGYWFECIEIEGKEMPFTLYLVWWNQGKHRKQMMKSKSISEVLVRLSRAYDIIDKEVANG